MLLVKTTSPKKYCVKPNAGIIKPKSTCDFIVMMQALKSSPLDMQCKDKFLVQSTVVAFGTTEEEITSGMFSKDSQKHIEETKLQVVLRAASDYQSLTPVDALLKIETSYMTSLKEPHIPVRLPVNGTIKQEPSYELSMPADNLQQGVETFPPDMRIKTMELITNNVIIVEDSRSFQVMDNTESTPVKNEVFYHEDNAEPKLVKYVDEGKLKLEHDIKELRSKVTAMDIKLAEAHDNFNKLREETKNILHDKATLEQELVMLRTRNVVRKFPACFLL